MEITILLNYFIIQEELYSRISQVELGCSTTFSNYLMDRRYFELLN